MNRFVIKKNYEGGISISIHILHLAVPANAKYICKYASSDARVLES